MGEVKGKIVGFAEYEPSGHVDCFYVHHEHQRLGIGKVLLQWIETELQKQNVHRLYAEVSVTARAFFESRGFTVVEERNAEYMEVSIKLYLMEKYL